MLYIAPKSTPGALPSPNSRLTPFVEFGSWFIFLSLVFPESFCFECVATLKLGTNFGASNLAALSFLWLITLVLCLSPGACIDPQMPHSFLSPVSARVSLSAEEFLAIVSFFLKYAFSRFGNFVGTALYFCGIAARDGGPPRGLVLFSVDARPDRNYDEGLRDGLMPGINLAIPWSAWAVLPRVAFLFLNTPGLMSILTSSFLICDAFLGVGRDTNLFILLFDLTVSSPAMISGFVESWLVGLVRNYSGLLWKASCYYPGDHLIGYFILI